MKTQVRNSINLYYHDLAKLPDIKTHPVDNINFSQNVAGKVSLKFRSLLKIGEIFGLTQEEMMKRIFINGINSEFHYWKSSDAVMVVNK